MKRWNGWGKTDYTYHFAESSKQFVERMVGKGEIIPDATLETVLKKVPNSRLPENKLYTTDAEIRLRHARGQSFPDWVALRYGTVDTFPDAVAMPSRKDDFDTLIDLAKKGNFHLIPYGGGTSVVGHINVENRDTPTLSVDLARYNQLFHLDEISHTATFGAGVCGPDMEETLRQHGFRFGHYPQSHEFSTLGGWIASRSVGTQCYYYGRIEHLFLGGLMHTPQGLLEMPPFSASAAGPDLRHCALGSEGRMGIISEATVRISPRPQFEHFYAVFYPDWDSGFAALREIVQARLDVSMLRLLDKFETETTLQLSGKEKLVKLADQGLRLIGMGEERCMMLFGITGSPVVARTTLHQVQHIARKHHGFTEKRFIGKLWFDSRFTTPYLRNNLWECGFALDTLESVFPWSRVAAVKDEVEAALFNGLQDENERLIVFSHLSHMYTDGASLYVTYLFRRTDNADQTLERWKKLKQAASDVIVKNHGTISHQHGVGIDHRPYLPLEKGALGMRSIQNFYRTFDPDGIMNPGKLY
ncbi:MAG TPA: FAD-binding oxidoreductase [Anaerolineaceae bacterium]|nr:FAD-binding oxidoreductase [Anaerolineaceae bacterium]